MSRFSESCCDIVMAVSDDDAVLLLLTRARAQDYIAFVNLLITRLIVALCMICTVALIIHLASILSLSDFLAHLVLLVEL